MKARNAASGGGDRSKTQAIGIPVPGYSATSAGDAARKRLNSADSLGSALSGTVNM